ncbi:MAG: glutamine--fructose-6-phosphate transaminase (isomerizing), partial [Clostridia bacterium]|nr:glutamine--fructose-6-phosphate transaminase (isomerizing) [Clostridia bacterium]
YYIDNHQSARLLPGEAHFFDLNGDEVTLPLTHVTWSAEAAQKGGYKHFMIKEIHEQPRAVQDTLNSLVHDRRIDLAAAGISEEQLSAVESVEIVACGSAWHVGMAAQYVIEDLAEVPVRVELASEFRYRKRLLGPGALVIVISQSGETADSLAALRAAKAMGVPTLAVVNVVGSSIAREADHVLYTLAGPEIAVATTKAYSAQLCALYAFATELALVKGKLSEEKYSALIGELLSLPDKMTKALQDKARIQWFASRHANARDIFFIGRGLDYAVCLEGSLKMKEISYIHSEAYAAGELKHGTISLVEQGTLIVGSLTQQDVLEKTVSNMAECRARGAYLVGIAGESSQSVRSFVDFSLFVPETDPHFMASLAIIPLQLLAYYTSVSKGLDVDKPRNLAKSVTVE